MAPLALQFAKSVAAGGRIAARFLDALRRGGPREWLGAHSLLLPSSSQWGPSPALELSTGLPGMNVTAADHRDIFPWIGGGDVRGDNQQDEHEHQEQEQDHLWFAVPKKQVTRHKKRLKTTVQKRIPLRTDIVLDPRTGQITRKHRMPVNWKDYLLDATAAASP
jgi:ribosomal protein L32